MPAAAAPLMTAAEQAGPAGWRISQVLAGVTVGGLWAGGRQDAWLAGDECADPATCGNGDAGNGTVVVRHWDGRAWRVVTPPAAYIDSPLDQGVAAVAATSGTNAWVLAARGAGAVASTDALHLTGNGWAAPVRLDAAIHAAVAPSPAQLWAFGEPSRSGPPGYVAHFNGRTWTHGSFPFNGTATAARSADDVWVGGGGDGMAGLGIEHWNGRRWHATPLPDLGVPPSDLLWATVSGLADAGPADVWADISTSDGASGNRPATIILRWNGKAWSRVAFPYAGSASAPVASDGHGGIWLATVSGVGDSAIEWFDHYAGGRWTRVRVPRGEGEQPAVLYLSSMSGTRSLWAAGQVDFADDGEAILTYGGQGTLPRASPGGSERASQDVGDRRGAAACAAHLGPAPVPEGRLGGGGARRELDRGAFFGAAIQDELKELAGDALTTPGAADHELRQREGAAGMLVGGGGRQRGGQVPPPIGGGTQRHPARVADEIAAVARFRQRETGLATPDAEPAREVRVVAGHLVMERDQVRLPRPGLAAVAQVQRHTGRGPRRDAHRPAPGAPVRAA